MHISVESKVVEIMYFSFLKIKFNMKQSKFDTIVQRFSFNKIVASHFVCIQLTEKCTEYCSTIDVVKKQNPVST